MKSKFSKKQRKEVKDRIIKNMQRLEEDDKDTKIVFLCVDQHGICGYTTDEVTKIIQAEKWSAILQEFKK